MGQERGAVTCRDQTLERIGAPVNFIDGDQGTTASLIYQRLLGRTDSKVMTLAAAERNDLPRRAEAINACNIAIQCLPDAAAREAVAAIINPAVRVIYASSAHNRAGLTDFRK